jgi:hypothetical protein
MITQILERLETEALEIAAKARHFFNDVGQALADLMVEALITSPFRI